MLRKRIISFGVICMLFCHGCQNVQNNATEQNENIISTNDGISSIQVFAENDVNVTPQITEYDFATAATLGIPVELRGTLPGATEGIWYIITINGVEYYYGKYDGEPETSEQLFGYSIIDSEYVLSNGLSVGMTEEAVLEIYPDMAVIDFEGNLIYNEVTGCLGWNTTAYPRSYLDTDTEWEYNGRDYFWTDQFDYIMVGDIKIESPDSSPMYMGLLIKDKTIAAITFYCPTAG